MDKLYNNKEIHELIHELNKAKQQFDYASNSYEIESSIYKIKCIEVRLDGLINRERIINL